MSSARRSDPPARLRQTADLLAVEPGMRILEIGGGRGVLAALLLQRLGDGRLVGIDRSTGAVAAAAERNAGAVEDGRAVFLPVPLENLDPATVDVVDLVVAVNVNLFWTGPARRELLTIKTVLAPTGHLWLIYHPPDLTGMERTRGRLDRHLTEAGYRTEVIVASEPVPQLAVRASPDALVSRRG